MLGSSLGVVENGEFSSIERTSFGENLGGSVASCDNFFTGKPSVEGLGYAFLFRNYRADVGKWQTSDPLGYPDGWNNLAYCGNAVTSCLDFLGLELIYLGEVVYVNSPVGEGTMLERLQGDASRHNGSTDIPEEFKVRNISEENSVFDSLASLQQKFSQVQAGDHVIVQAHTEYDTNMQPTGYVLVGENRYAYNDPQLINAFAVLKDKNPASVTLSMCGTTPEMAIAIKNAIGGKTVYYNRGIDQRNSVWDVYTTTLEPPYTYYYDPTKCVGVKAE
jgi:RHS repeat-associated protein